MGRALGRRAAFKASKIAGGLVWALWQFLIMILPLLVCSVMMTAIASLAWPSAAPGLGPSAGAIALAALLAWGAFDTARADKGKLFAQLDRHRPIHSLALISLSGFALMFDRFILALKGINLGIAKPLTGAPETKSWAGEPTPATLRGCVEPVWEEIRAGWGWMKLAPAWTMTMAWGMAALPLGIPLMLLSLVEEWVVKGWASGKKAWAEGPERARETMEALANEGARDLASAERVDLSKAAKGGKEGVSRGPREGL